MPTVVQVVEVNRVRLLELGATIEALAGAVAAGEGTSTYALEALEPVRELLRALRQLAEQPLPEVLMQRTTEVPVELEAPAHELEQLADELERLASDASEHETLALAGEFADRLRERAGELRTRTAG